MDNYKKRINNYNNKFKKQQCNQYKVNKHYNRMRIF